MGQSRTFLTILLILLPLALSGQQGITLKGRVYNSKTGDPVPQASIYVNETLVGGSSDDQGRYEIRLPATPVMIVISSVGYTRRYFTIAGPVPGDFNVPLEPSLHEIPEVLVTGKRAPVSISDKQDLYVMDYDFYDNHVLLLGNPGKKSLETHLILMDRMGNTINRKVINRGNNLYRDPFNNIHLLCNDTAYQVYFDGKELQLLFPADKDRFIRSFPEFIKILNNKIILRQYDFDDQALLYYFYNPSDSTIQKFWAEATTEVYRKTEGLMSSIRITPSGKTSSHFNLFNSDERFIKMAFYAPIFCPLEVIKDTIYIFNFNNGLIETYSYRGFHADTPTSFSFHKDPGWQKKLYVDAVTGKAYTHYMKNGISVIREIDLKKGALAPREIKIPNFAYISKIVIHDGYLYFLYEEKQYPKFMRLFRMPI
jgi:hypothetical protein